VLKLLYDEKEYKAIAKIVRSMQNNGSIKSEASIDYLSRYSNTLITVSSLRKMDIAQTKSNEDWLFRNYVYKNISK